MITSSRTTPSHLYLPAPWTQVFLSQCFDHCLGLLLTALFLTSGLSLFDMNVATTLSHATPFFWVGMLGTLWACDLLIRGLAILLLGFTAGNLMTGLRPVYGPHELPAFWMGQFFESFHVAVPGLWALELIARAQRSRYSGLRYKTEV